MADEKSASREYEYNGPTVTVELVPEYPLFRVICKQRVDKQDVIPAFQTIMNGLEQTEKRMYVLVDIRQNTQLPIKEIVGAAFWGPHRHPNLVAWLVVGSNALARSIARLMSQISRRQNVQWFENEAEALTYIEQHMANETQASC